jgi:molecular chaperone DnaJ
MHGRGRGDLFVHLVVDVPTDLDDTSRDLLRQLAEHRGEEVREHTGGLFSRRRGSKK